MALWETPWMSFTSCVIVLKMLSLTVCWDTLVTSGVTCPDPKVIAPCQCTSDPTFGMDMDCSNVTSEDELRTVFSNNFSFTDFRKFTIKDNYKITSLQEGDLGSASFTEINIVSTSLREIEDDALTGSLDTLVTLHVQINSLNNLPDISGFTGLKQIEVYFNQMTMFPSESSATLLELDLSLNTIDDVPEDAIVEMTSIEWLNLYSNSLTEIRSHTFSRNEHLNYLNLADNKLTAIPDDAIILHGPNTSLYLQNNQITSLTYEAVSSVKRFLILARNKLTEVPEKVFRPLLEDSVMVDLSDNPLKCGCDMAWLVLNRTLLNGLYELYYTRCPDGEKLIDLDPEIYKVMCPNATAVPL